VELLPLHQRPWDAREVGWRAAAGRAVHLAAIGESLVKGGADLDPLPHQLRVLSRALDKDPVRLLLADEVGLGKTIEAGLIISELQARGLVRRVVVIAPRGVQLQWVAEMRDRFHQDFVIVGPGGISVDAGIDPWRAFDRIVCSTDAVKPIRRRAGWDSARLEEHNRRRFGALADGGWDLVVFDEAHHVAGSTAGVARHELAQELAAKTQNVLLLSATPHSGKSEAFTRLVALLDISVADQGPLTRSIVAPLVARTEKRDARGMDGRPLFQPRATSLEVVAYGERHLEQVLYDSVTEYVRHGYARAKREKRPAVGFLLLLMQRLVSSSTAAVLAALEKRLAALTAEGEQLELFAEASEQWGELTGEEQFDALGQARGAASEDEKREVEILADLARKTGAAGIDAKAAFLLELLLRLQREEGDPGVKVVVFTEFVQTQQMLLSLFESAAISTTAINGSMDLGQRALAQDAFRNQVRVLVSTDAGGEGINLQFAHLVVNYDLPWNPMRIEQRIGRVDRIGQSHPVRAFNLVLENSVDQRVLAVLEEKLWRILAELGADKAGDVLESASTGVESLYADAILEPEMLDREVEQLATETRQTIEETTSLRSLMGSDDASYRAPGEEIDRFLELTTELYAAWSGSAGTDGSEILRRTPEAVTGEAIPVIAGEVSGVWSLWEVSPRGGSPQRDCIALFHDDRGSLRPDLASRLWLRLCEGPAVTGRVTLSDSDWEALMQAGIDHSYSILRGLAPEENWQAPWIVPRLVVKVSG
jgi:SNF2 family DNA or RNA helicase